MTTRARAACVIGWPIGHSRSPLIHNYWLKTYGIAGEYRREAVPPQEFATFVQSLAAHGYVGANVTVPHKEAALACSQPDAHARAVGAANTLWLDDGVLRSTNTDVEGFLDNLDDCVPAWSRDRGEALVLGAGGAARAVINALLERGFERVMVANRSRLRADALRERFGPRVEPVAWERRNAALAGVPLLVNTTTLGMHGQPSLDIDIALLPGHAVVADLVYVPLETPLVRAARARDLKVADGVGMLLHQAVRGFQLWFGTRPAVTADLRALLEADIGLPQARSSE